jgi:hypothetical protein
MLRIVHVSDLHLFVEPDGTNRPIGELSRIVTWAMRHPKMPLVGGFNVHEGKALKALRRAITDLCEHGGHPVLLIQSGDVSTFGARRTPSGSFSFPEWEFWRAERNQIRITQPVGWIDLYGNHDVWPGTLPALAAGHVQAARDELRRQHFGAQLPERFELPIGRDRVEVYTLNTVQHTALANTLARGEFGFDHPDLTAPMAYPGGSTDPLQRVSELVAANPVSAGARVLRVLVMHHPPHFFGAPPGAAAQLWARLTAGPLQNAATLLGWLQSQEHRGEPFQLVLAGHRHLIDPATGAHPTVLGGSRAVQLVCGTPTQTQGGSDPDNSFSVYDVDFGTTVTVSRTLYERPATARDFRAAGAAIRMI